jgi:AcrR family transcriptional regulator
MDEKQKDLILKSCKLFQKYGIKSVSMDDIARECGISKKTLYEMVSDKTDIVRQVLDFEFDKDNKVPHNFNFGSNLNAVESMFYVYQSASEFFTDFNFSMEYDLKKYYPSLYEVNLKRRREHLYGILIKNMKQGIDEGFFRGNLNMDIIAKIHILKIEGIMQTDIFEDANYTIVDIFKELFIYHYMAIATPKGVEEFNKKVEELNRIKN